MFINDPRMQAALELRAKRRHEFVLDNLYSEASAYIANLEATADANHRQQLSFVRESTAVLVGQLHSENRVFRQIADAGHRAVQSLQMQLARRDQECREERSGALRLGARHSEVESLACTLAAENRQHEQSRAELRTSFDEKRLQMINYLGHEFEEKLQWEENECHFRLTSKEQQCDNLIADLEDRNAELIVEVNSLRFVLASRRWM